MIIQSICPCCGRPINDEHYINRIATEIANGIIEYEIREEELEDE